MSIWVRYRCLEELKLGILTAIQNHTYEFCALDTSEPVNCSELDGNRDGGYKQRGRQTGRQKNMKENHE